MILVDSALQKLQAENKPLRVGVVGAGFMARGIILQIIKFTPGMEVVGIANRTVDKARNVLHQAEVEDRQIVVCENENQVKEAGESHKIFITDNPELLCTAPQVDVIVEVTGALEYSAHLILKAFDNKKHVVMMNAEIDGTVGSILKEYAKKAGVVYTLSDGDQPGVIMNLYRYVKGLGAKPVLCGNIKGLHDPYRNPTTQEAYAKQWGQDPYMVTSFADGTKISFEQAVVANGIGMDVLQRGMMGPTMAPATPVEKTVELFDVEKLSQGNGFVDYVVGADPNGGIFVLATHDHPIQQHYLKLYKVGAGPLYCFYVPYHLCHFETPSSIARAVLFNDPTLTPLDRPYVEVITAAKKDLKAGDTIDKLGGYMTYGLAENALTARKENLLPIGLSEGCIIKRDISKDAVITFDDVEIPKGRLIDKLWQEQFEVFLKPLLT